MWAIVVVVANVGITVTLLWLCALALLLRHTGNTVAFRNHPTRHSATSTTRRPSCRHPRASNVGVRKSLRGVYGVYAW